MKLNYLKKGFTLAEVLITLGIIGVVAAMTMPVLVAKINDTVLENQAKKAQNRIGNGYRLMMAKEDIFLTANLPILASCNDLNCVSAEHKKTFNIVKDSVSGLSADALPEEYTVIGKEKPSSFKWENADYMFATNDGMIFGVLINDDGSDFSVVVDLNGIKRPNAAVKDLRKYTFTGTGMVYDISSELEKSKSCSLSGGDCTTREECVAACYEYYRGSGVCLDCQNTILLYDGRCMPPSPWEC